MTGHSHQKKDFMILAKANAFRRALAEENGK